MRVPKSKNLGSRCRLPRFFAVFITCSYMRTTKGARFLDTGFFDANAITEQIMGAPKLFADALSNG